MENKTSPMASVLRSLGFLIITMGVVTVGYLIHKSERTLSRASGEALAVAIYTFVAMGIGHLAIGFLCLGVSSLLKKQGDALAIAPAASTPKTTKCPSCGKVFDGNLKGQFCDECGSPL